MHHVINEMNTSPRYRLVCGHAVPVTDVNEYLSTRHTEKIIDVEVAKALTAFAKTNDMVVFRATLANLRDTLPADSCDYFEEVLEHERRAYNALLLAVRKEES